MRSLTMFEWLALSVLIPGALCASVPMAFGGGWEPGVPGYVAWALMLYSVLSVILLVRASLASLALFSSCLPVHVLLLRWAGLYFISR